MRVNRRYAHTSVCFFACKGNRLASKPTHDHKKHWNAVARDLSDSRRNHYTLSRRNRSNRDGSRGAHSGHFDLNWQVVPGFQFHCSRRPAGGYASVGRRKMKAPTLSLQPYNRLPVHSAPTAAEISRTTMLSEITIWIIARTFAQRASSGASVGPNVELCVNATNR